MNQECVPLAPNTGMAPSQVHESWSLVLLIVAALLITSVVLAIVYRKRLPKLFSILLIPLFIFGTLSLGGFSPSVNAQAVCDTPVTPSPAAITTEDDVFQSELPSAANGNSGNNLLKAFVSSMYGSDELLFTFNYSAYYMTFADGSPQSDAPLLKVNLLNNDTTIDGVQLDPLSVDLDSTTPGVQQTLTAGAYYLEYNPLTDELTVTITDARQALEEIISDTLIDGMPLSEYTPIENRPVAERTIVKKFAYTVTDTTGAHSATANAVVTVVGEAVSTPIPL